MDSQLRSTNRTLTNNDIFVIAIAFIGLILIMALLLDNRLFFKFGFQTLGHHQKIAITSHSIKDVRRRIDTDVVWLPLFNSDDVFESDAIYTGQNSESEITLDSGIKLQMESESLIVVHRDQIELKQGRIWGSLNKSQTLKIITPKGVSEISGKTGLFKIDAVSQNDPSAESTPHKFTFEEPVLPTILVPKDGSSINSLKKGEKKTIALQWSSLEHVSKFNVQISTDSNFKEVVWESEATDQNATSIPLASGSYYWRVQGVDSDRALSWSKSGYFKLQQSPANLLQAPKVKKKRQTYKIQSLHPLKTKSLFEKIFNMFLPMARAETVKSNIPELDWEIVPDATAYEVEIATDQEFKNIFIKKKVTTMKITWDTHKPGTFYWHVRGIDQDGNPGPFSEVSALDLILVSPVVHPSIAKPGSEGKITFSWNRVSFAKGYEVQFSENADFSDVIALTSQETSLETTPPPNAKYWRVRATSNLAQYNGDFSKAQPISNQTKISSMGQIKPLRLNPLAPRPGHPILFDPTDNGIDISEPTFDYEVSEKNEVRVGEIFYDGEAIRLSFKKDTSPTFTFSWPKTLLDSGRIFLLSKDGKATILSDSFSSSDFSGSGDWAVLSKPISSKELEKLGSQTDLRFCAGSTEEPFKNSFCSKLYSCQFNKSICTALPYDGPLEPSVKINNIRAPTRGNKIVKFNEKLIFESIGHGSLIHLETQLLPLKFRDVVMQDKETIVLSGNGATPYNAKVLERDDFNWRTAMLLTKPTIYFLGENNIVFKTDIKINKRLPFEDQRGYINFSSPRSTYSSEAKLLGLFEKHKNKVSSTQREAHATSDKEFEWYFSTPEKGDINTNKISLLENNDDSFVGRYSVYHGYNYEVTGRFTAALTGASPLILGELMGAASFERIFGTENRTFSFQRWGITAKYFNTLSKGTDTSGNAVNLSGYNGDLRYRLKSGIANQDETFGLLLGYQSVTYDSNKGSMLGVGGFWTNPMPSFVDRFFNYIKWFRYPKILDAEATYYPISATSGVTIGTNLNLLFRGKMFVKPSLFLEASLAYRQYNYTQANLFQVQAALLVWTGGIGLDF